MRIEEAIQQKKFENEYQKLSINLLFTASQVSIYQQRFFREYGLTLPQYNVLRILRGQKGNPIGVNNLGSRMIDKTSNASRLVEKLRVKNLVERNVCSDDRRQMEVTITKEGLTLLEEMDKEMYRINDMYSALDASEAKMMNDLFDKLRTAEAFKNI